VVHGVSHGEEGTPVSDQNSADKVTPQQPPAVSGAFDWLIESHQQSAPMAPLTDDIPLLARAAPVLPPVFPDPEPDPAPYPPSAGIAQLPPPDVADPLIALPPPPSMASPYSAPPAFQTPTSSPVVPSPTVPSPTVPSPSVSAPPSMPPTGPAEWPILSAEPLAPTPFADARVGSLGLERHQPRTRSANGPLDWAAFVVAFVAPPLGALLGVGAAVAGSRTKGYAASIAKAAIGIGAALTLVLGVAFIVYTKVSDDQAAHDAIVASSRAYCAKLESNPAALASDTFGWPAPGETIPASITSMQSYETTWKSLVRLAPAGIRADTQRVESAAASIISSVQSTQTLDDADNVAQMHDVVAETGIKSWVSNYCG
jgi:hypothetical protein